MDDLISKGQLLESLNDWIDENTTIQDVLRWISEYEIAYNIDKVKMQIRRNYDVNNWGVPYAISLDKALKIIEAGGVNET